MSPPFLSSTHGVGTPPSPCLTSTRGKELGMVGREGWGGDATRVQKPHLSVAALTIFFFFQRDRLFFFILSVFSQLIFFIRQEEERETKVN